MADLSWPGATRRSCRNADSVRVEMAVPDEAYSLFFVATYKVGVPAGQFAIAPSAYLRGGTLWRALRAAGAYSSASLWLVNLQITVLPEVAPNNTWLIPDAAGIAHTCELLTQTNLLSTVLSQGCRRQSRPLSRWLNGAERVAKFLNEVGIADGVDDCQAGVLPSRVFEQVFEYPGRPDSRLGQGVWS